jgi:tripartite-type tricarboxylate transporter receptor subunit TctC
MFKHLSRIALLALATSGIVLVWIGCARTETYPSRPIQVIVPFAAGGGIDVIARIFQPKMEEILGQPIVIENRPGTVGVIGTNSVAKAAPDGVHATFYTDPHVVNTYLYKQLPYRE